MRHCVHLESEEQLFIPCWTFLTILIYSLLIPKDRIYCPTSTIQSATDHSVENWPCCRNNNFLPLFLFSSISLNLGQKENVGIRWVMPWDEVMCFSDFFFTAIFVRRMMELEIFVQKSNWEIDEMLVCIVPSTFSSYVQKF